MHFFHLSGRADGPPFCFCNGARNFSEISGEREGGREGGRKGGRKEEKQKSVTVHYAVIIFLPPSPPSLSVS